MVWGTPPKKWCRNSSCSDGPETEGAICWLGSAGDEFLAEFVPMGDFRHGFAWCARSSCPFYPVTKGQHGDQLHGLGNPKQSLDLPLLLLLADPHKAGSQPLRLGHQLHLLQSPACVQIGTARTVHDDSDGQRRLTNKRPRCSCSSYSIKGVLISNHNKMPRLAIAGTGSPSGRLQDFVDHLLWYWVRLEFPYRAPSSDALVNFHPCISSSPDLGGNKQIAYPKRLTP
jgi:hypothetical protein